MPSSEISDLEIDCMQWTPVARYGEGNVFYFLLLLDRLGLELHYHPRSADDVIEYYYRVKVNPELGEI